MVETSVEHLLRQSSSNWCSLLSLERYLNRSKYWGAAMTADKGLCRAGKVFVSTWRKPMSMYCSERRSCATLWWHNSSCINQKMLLTILLLWSNVDVGYLVCRWTVLELYHGLRWEYTVITYSHIMGKLLLLYLLKSKIQTLDIFRYKRRTVYNYDWISMGEIMVGRYLVDIHKFIWWNGCCHSSVPSCSFRTWSHRSIRRFGCQEILPRSNILVPFGRLGDKTPFTNSDVAVVNLAKDHH